MSCIFLGRSAALMVVALTGCGIVGARKDMIPKWPLAADRSKGASKELAMAGSGRDPVLPDPSTMIPAPPRMDLIPEIPGAPPKDDHLVAIKAPSGVVPASGNFSPENALVMAHTRERPGPAGESNLDALRRIHQRAA